MNFLISDAWADAPAAAGAPAQSSPFVTLIMLGVLFAAFYFILIRPQAKRAKEHKTMIAALAKGDEVVTGGGVLGRVTNLGEAYVTVDIAEGVEIKVQRQAIQTVLPKGTIKSV
ncbi:preprotein translocase subunit YajC [Sulfuricaulis sp.]|uniref:preprotein translocase subunit YajC n=1 Tax=Sulfuricaulis sp. TaxID=2003553 RepID=UPI00355AAED6